MEIFFGQLEVSMVLLNASSIGSNSPSAQESLFQLALFVKLLCSGDLSIGLILLQFMNGVGVVDIDFAVDKSFGLKLVDKIAVACLDGDVLCEFSLANGSASSFN
uniref:Uncharacterized protein n=1 Tax=Glossina pallidipes TaxID=7398 RepID=A0A1B0A8X4_GLOPL